MRERLLVLALAIVTTACGGGGESVRPTAATPDGDHWESVQDLRFVAPARCATGPFEVRFPAREITWARRLTIEAYGPRRIPLHYSIVRRDGDSIRSELSGSWDDVGPEAHARCRGDVTTTIAAPSASSASGGEILRASDAVTRPGDPAAPELALSAMPELVPHAGEPDGYVVALSQGYAYFTRGVPTRYADGIHTYQYDDTPRDAAAEIVVRIWLSAPGDLDGIVFRFRDQDLVPDGSPEEYAARFAARVESERVRVAEHHATVRAEEEREVARCQREPEEARCVARRVQHPGQPPPPPLVELQPPTPSADVDWVPGFWRFDQTLLDYVWVPGTFVLRPAPPQPAPEVVVRAPEPPPPPMPPPPPPEPTATREIDVAIPPPPPPRAEVIPVPPRVPGVVWVAGAWRLEGRAWVWVPGAWQLPPSAGARPIAPTVRERSGVRIYVPGGWIDIR
ncbi:YXWGXW repeat-containing protein [Sandaracinus amylolyticus]|uniref:Uncharacterized protein n=1 Tax=Sandaracinus amylolyticus TaxID=927083 RepID=A0A0F6YJV3_9BACT|nr:YXWGXW repeat-containing protein [Sandaracinus amylolyticus]AKF06582.1 hypothetical protein DB32_003731 [Sandaracinus amylolyticus]